MGIEQSVFLFLRYLLGPQQSLKRLILSQGVDARLNPLKHYTNNPVLQDHIVYTPKFLTLITILVTHNKPIHFPLNLITPLPDVKSQTSPPQLGPDPVDVKHEVKSE